MIKIQNLKKIYNGTTVLDIENLDIAQGELVGLVGNNGAGKTTLLRLVLDLIRLTMVPWRAMARRSTSRKTGKPIRAAILTDASWSTS